MRLYVSILAASALTISACGKKPAAEAPKAGETAKPEEAKKEEPKKEEPKKEEAKVEPVKEEPKKEEPKPVAAVDKIEAVQKGIENWAAGKFEDTVANYTDDAVLYNVGSPKGAEVKGKQAIADFWKAQVAGMTDVKAKASRIIDAGEMTIVEAVTTAKTTVKGADGADVTKEVSVPWAMIVAYNAEGKITSQWTFMDEVSMLQQIGAIPGLPEGFVAAKLPEATEVVKGEANPANIEACKAFAAKMKPDTIEAAIAEHMADDFTMVDFMTGKTINKAEMAGHMKTWMAMIADTTMTNDKQISVGEYVVDLTTMTGTFKGGIPGVEAKDQKVTTHMLEISRVVDGKFKSWAGYGNGMELMSQLGVLGGAAEKPAEGEKPADGANAAAGDIGVPECDKFIKAMTACVEKAPAAAKDAVASAFKQTVDGWKQAIATGGEASKAALKTGCESAYSAAKQGMGAMCPGVAWE